MNQKPGFKQISVINLVNNIPVAIIMSFIPFTAISNLFRSIYDFKSNCNEASRNEIKHEN
ncbi:hypothetical protein [Metaclostridioides mangenotii]|uniref:hypothetical protein n=1 Tax=Metaclostridioides mangenotii TaxID=1540 RepID=UPI0028EB581A|nr:hypothetical protein [Clostridioides mangenotii]